jgi:hypothetical protein
MTKINGDEARDETCYPLVCFDLDEIFDPNTIVHVLETLVFHCAVAVYEILEGVCEIILI